MHNDTPIQIERPLVSGSLVLLAFTTTMFLSASLLFFVQPLFARITLPEIGGAPAVWTTAMLFFQSVLIGGYVYAHVITKYLPLKAQVILHLSLWAVALFFLPLGISTDWSLSPDQPVTGQVLILFAASVGVPFAVLSANAPLIQSWYRASGGPSADDPYFLYGASNLGSMIALLGYPFVAEPLFGVTTIGHGFTAGFVVLGALLLSSGLLARGATSAHVSDETTEGTIHWQSYAFWLVLAFIPSSLMLALTTRLSTDLGSLPMLWVIPLALYLFTFVLAFSNRFPNRPGALKLLAAVSLGWLIYSNEGGLSWFSVLSVALALGAFFLITLWAHRTLFDTRPNAKYLTQFYVTMSVGGACGGLFNSIIAPLAFDAVWEDKITIAIAVAVLAIPFAKLPTGKLPMVLASTLALGIGSALIARAAGLEAGLWYIPVAGAAVVMAAILWRYPIAAVFAVTAIIIIQPPFKDLPSIFADRSFFGLHQVYDSTELRMYENGTTLHGVQFISDLDAERPRPLSYYHREGPMGQFLQSETGRSAQRIGIVGLGVGSLACYAVPGQDWDFYEIDSLVDDVARNPDFFTYLSACTPDAPTHLGDARVVLEAQEDIRFDVLVVDAYSSDAIPVHLTTLEAIELYRNRLTDNGVLLFHISNRFYNVDIPLARAAEALGLKAWIKKHRPKITDQNQGITQSDVVAFARDSAHAPEIANDETWVRLKSDGKPLWTDDYANVLEILRIKLR